MSILFLEVFLNIFFYRGIHLISMSRSYRSKINCKRGIIKWKLKFLIIYR